MRREITTTAAALLLGAVLAAPGSEPAHGGEELLDYARIQRIVPELRTLTEKSSANATRLHELMERIDAENLSAPDETVVRTEIKETLEEQLATKKEVVAMLRDVLGVPPTGRSDEEIMAVIHGTTLHGINWNDVTFRKCVNDLARALKIRIRMAYHVVQMNRVTLQFNEAPAATVLATLCNYFELRYTVIDGEVMLFKKITPNEARFLEYQEQHPDVKLKYWDREDASGEYKKEKKTPQKEGSR